MQPHVGHQNPVSKSGVQLFPVQKANKEARLVEGKVGFISEASYEVGETPVQTPGSPHWQSAGKDLHRWREWATSKNSTIRSDSHPEIDHR